MRCLFRNRIWVRAGRVALAALAVVALAGPAGCSGQQKPSTFDKVFNGGEVKPSQVQAQLMALADEVIARISESAEDVEREATDLRARRLAHTLKLVTAEAAIANVSVPNPIVGLLDMVVMTTLMRSRVEVLAPRVLGENAELMVAAYERAEQDAWAMAEEFLPAPQLEALQQAISTWNLKNQDLRFVARIRLSEFANERLQSVTDGSQTTASLPSSLLDLVFLDPLSGLDPAVQEIEQARLLAERIAFQAQRMPRLLRWEAEALYYDMITNPEVSEMVASFNDAAAGIENVGSLAERFPQVLEEERTAAIDQFASSMTREARTLLRDVDGASEPVQRTLEQYTQAAEATTEAAQAVDEVTKKGQTLAEQLGIGDEKPEDAGEGMELAEVESAAESIEDTAEEVSGMLSEANTLADQPALSNPQYVAQMTERSSDELLDEIMEVGVVIVLVAAAALFLAIVGAMWVSSHLTRRHAARDEYAWRH